jgi:hypothetical protein
MGLTAVRPEKTSFYVILFEIFFNKTILSNRYPLQWMKNIQALRGLYVEQHLHIRKAAFTV